jgi:RNA polymerase sigma-70 factor (ECF subfamily)
VSGREGSLLEALRERQPEACEAFVETHYRGVFDFFLWLTRNAETAADLTQESFAAFWASTDRLAPEAVPDLKAWLYGIARNRWRKRCRDDRPACASLDEALERPDAAPGPEALAIRAFEAEAVVRAVGELPADYREALVLRVFRELSYRQVAEALGISEGLARWRVHRARLWLRAALEEEVGKEESGAASRG